METNTDFELWIDSAAETPTGADATSYPVRVIASPAGPATGALHLDARAKDFQQQLGVVLSDGPALDARMAFGQALFEALFKSQVRDAWKTSRGRVDAGEADGLRLRLWISAPELAVLPWELLHEEGRGFLATDANLALARYLPVPEPPLLSVSKPLRVLVVVEAPENLPPIQPAEVDRLESSLQDLGGAIEFTMLRNVALAKIHHALLQGYHVLHFLGHGKAGKLALVQENGQDAHLIDDVEFAQLFQGRRNLRLVILNACHSSQPEGAPLFSGMGPALVQKQMPAVVAMQYPTVQQKTAGLFNQAFYAALANGKPVDFAINEARQQISAGDLLASRDWSTPVLYMGTRNGRILSLLQEGDETVEQRWESVQMAVQVSEQARSALDALVQDFREVAHRHQELNELAALAGHLADLQEGFLPCQRIVQEAGFDMARLMSQFPQLQAMWGNLRNNQLIQLSVFVDAHPELDVTSWYEGLQSQATAIDSDLTQLAVGDAGRHINSFGSQLQLGRAQTRQQLDRAIDELVQISDRTLGRL